MAGKPRKTNEVTLGEGTKVVFPPLHKAQRQVHDDPHRFRVLVAGRRFGKSWLALRECGETAIVGKDVWWISPTYNNVLVHWRNAKLLLGPLATYTNEQQKYMEFNYNGKRGSLTFKSGDQPNNLLGAGLDLVVIDEAAYIDPDVWYRVVRPALSDRQGRALLISTPNGVANYFHSLYLNGLSGEDEEWAAFHFPSVDNPKISAKEVASAKRDLPDLRFRQEYLAEFVSDAGGVFRGVEQVAILAPQAKPVDGHVYICGIDWGRRNDFTVVSIFDLITAEQVDVIRFGEIGFAVQRDRIKNLYDTWKFDTMYVEANSIGAPNIEALQADGLPITPVYMTNPMKTSLVEHLAFNIERQVIKLLKVDKDYKVGEIQLGELLSYTISRTRGGLSVTYNAPRHGHDDTVIALMLVNQGLYAVGKPEMAIAANPFYGGKEINLEDQEGDSFEVKDKKAILREFLGRTTV